MLYEGEKIAAFALIFIVDYFLGCGYVNAANKLGQNAQNAMIVAAFGTSLTSHAGWLQPLQKQLTRCLGYPVTVLDFGRNGATSGWGVANVATMIRSHPDVVLIEFASNDAAWFKGVSLQQSRENITEIVQAIKEADRKTKIFLMTMNPAFGLRGWIRPSLNIYYGLYKSLAGQLGIGLIDNLQKWEALTKNELRAGIPDGGHPLPEMASRILVPTIARAIGGVDCGQMDP